MQKAARDLQQGQPSLSVAVVLPWPKAQEPQKNLKWRSMFNESHSTPTPARCLPPVAQPEDIDFCAVVGLVAKCYETVVEWGHLRDRLNAVLLFVLRLRRNEGFWKFLDNFPLRIGFEKSRIHWRYECARQSLAHVWTHCVVVKNFCMTCAQAEHAAILTNLCISRDLLDLPYTLEATENASQSPGLPRRQQTDGCFRRRRGKKRPSRRRPSRVRGNQQGCKERRWFPDLAYTATWCRPEAAVTAYRGERQRLCAAPSSRSRSHVPTHCSSARWVARSSRESGRPSSPRHHSQVAANAFCCRSGLSHLRSCGG